MSNSPNLSLTFIDFENIVKEAEQRYGATIDYVKFAEAIYLHHEQHNIKNCGVYAYSDFDTAIEGVQTKLYRLGIQARHVVTKAPDKEKRTNASDIEMSLDILTFIYENPLINDYVIISGDGDLLHVIQRLRLKGKTIHIIGFERMSQHLISLADYVTKYDQEAPFLNKITDHQREKWARELLDDDNVALVLYHLDQLENEKPFVSFSYFHRVLTNKFDKFTIDEALTKAKKAGLVSSRSRTNPNDERNPTSTIEINRDNDIAITILNKIKVRRKV